MDTKNYYGFANSLLNEGCENLDEGIANEILSVLTNGSAAAALMYILGTNKNKFAAALKAFKLKKTEEIKDPLERAKTKIAKHIDEYKVFYNEVLAELFHAKTENDIVSISKRLSQKTKLDADEREAFTKYLIQYKPKLHIKPMISD